MARRRRRRPRPTRTVARRPVAVRALRPVRRVGEQRPRHVGDGRVPVLHRLARPRADLGARAAGPAARRRPRRARRARRAARARAQRPRPAASRSPTSTPRSPPTPGWCRRGRLRAAARAPAQRPHPGRRRLGLRDAHRPQGRAVRHDRPARPARRGLHRRRPDVERQHPADLRGRRRVGEGQDGRRDRRARPAAAGGGDAGPRRRRRARRRAARGARLVGARGRHRLPRPAVQVLGDAVGAPRPGPGDRRPLGDAAAGADAGLRRDRGRTTPAGAAARGPAHHRGHHELGRPGGRALPRRPRRRTTSRSSGPPGPATRALFWVGPNAGPAAPAPPPGHVLLRDEPQQARRLHRPAPSPTAGRRSSSW